MRGGSTRNLSAVLWTSIAATIVAIGLLAMVGSSVSTGWRIYVVEEVLRIGWAATAAILAAALSLFVLRSLVPTGAHLRGSPALAAFNVLSTAAAFVSALVTLSHFMSPWSLSAAIPAAVVLAIWALAAWTAISLRENGE